MGKYEFTIICDDIRRELNNKVTIVGMYSDVILFRELPATLNRLSIIQRWSKVPEHGEFKITIKGPSFNVPIFSLEFKEEDRNQNLPRSDYNDFMISLNNLNFKQEGDYKIVSFFGDDINKPDMVYNFSVKKYNIL